MILLHIIDGLVGLTSGAIALSTRKGGKLHRKSGMIFVYAMTVLSASGAVMDGSPDTRKDFGDRRYADLLSDDNRAAHRPSPRAEVQLD